MKIRLSNKKMKEQFTQFNLEVMKRTIFRPERLDGSVPTQAMMMAAMTNPSREIVAHPLRMLGVSACFIPEIAPELYLTPNCELALTGFADEESVKANVRRNGAPDEAIEASWQEVQQHNEVIQEAFDANQDMIQKMNRYARISWREAQLTDPVDLADETVTALEVLGFRDIAPWPNADDIIGAQATFDVSLTYVDVPIEDEEYTLSIAVCEDSIVLLGQEHQSQYFKGHPAFAHQAIDYRLPNLGEALLSFPEDISSTLVSIRDHASTIRMKSIFGRNLKNDLTFCSTCRKPITLGENPKCHNCGKEACPDCMSGDFCSNCNADKRLSDYSKDVENKSIAELLEEL